jgi:hypothetical protein
MADGGIVRDEATGDIIVLPDAPVQSEGEVPHTGNLAAMLDEATLTLLGTTLTTELSHDLNGRADWETLAKRYIEALGLGPESAPDDYEYEFADTSNHPLLLKSLTNYQAKALSALMPSPDTVVFAVPDVDLNHIEDVPTRKAAKMQVDAAVERVRDFYTWYLLTALPSYVEDTDQIISDSGLQGAGFRRIVVDRSYTKTPVRPIFVPLEDLILSYDAKNFRGSGRLSHRYTVSTSDLVRGIQTGIYRPADVVAGMSLDRSPVTEARDRLFGVTESWAMTGGDHRLYDVFTYLFLADDAHPMNLARPYVVTIHSQTQEVLAIRRNWREGDPDETPIEHFAGYIYSPGRNALTAVGLGALLTNMTLALRKAQRRALDAAYLANHPSGFVASGMSIRDDSTRFVPGELRPVDISNGDIRSAILINPFKGPDAGLLQLYDRMDAAGKDLGNLASIDFASMMKSGIAAGPALAAYDESTEFQTSVHRRLYRGHQTELTIIHDHMRLIFGGQRITYGTGKYLEPDDLSLVTIRPAMKPGFVSRQRTLIEAQAILELAQASPDIVNKREAIERFLSAVGAHGAADLLVPDPAQQEIPSTDPMNEYIRLMSGKPLKAAPTQNHRAHIDAHKAQLDGLQTSQVPVQTGQLAATALAAHIAEHEALDLAVNVAAMTGIPLEQFIQGIPPEMEAQLAPQLAQAIIAVEQQRRPKDDTDPRVAVEQIRAQTKVAVEEMQAQQAELNRNAQKELTRIKEEAATYRNDMDNKWAVVIAEMKTAKPQLNQNPAPLAGNPSPRLTGMNPTP